MNQGKVHQFDRQIKILFIAAEAEPFVKVGGLGDVAGSLPVALKQLAPQLDIRLAIPFYDSIHRSGIKPEPVTSFQIPSIIGDIEARVYQTTLRNLPVYLIDGDPITANKVVYGTNFELDAEKFIFFSLACLYLPIHVGWQIDILHANDWHTAVALHELASRKEQYPGFRSIKSVITLHNLPFMGTGSKNALEKFKITPAKNPRMPGWSRSLPLPMGLNSADRIIAVSPTYAREILTSSYGCDLQNFLQTKSKKLSGILNGIDFTSWNPIDDKCIPENYSLPTLLNRQVNKIALQIEFSFSINPKIPILTFIGRLDQQKGVGIAVETLQSLHGRTWRAIILGTGDKKLEAKIHELQTQFPDQIRAALRYDGALAHRLYAGADILLMPSRYEPCGLAQMIAMRYGCVPVAQATGGLVDTIRDFNSNPETATGFLCTGKGDLDFLQTIELAMDNYRKVEIWQHLQQNGMREDNSWKNSAEKYYNLYCSLC